MELGSVTFKLKINNQHTLESVGGTLSVCVDCHGFFSVCVFITAGPITMLFAGVEEEFKTYIYLLRGGRCVLIVYF